jgi:hypothetical protein
MDPKTMNQPGSTKGSIQMMFLKKLEPIRDTLVEHPTKRHITNECFN